MSNDASRLSEIIQRVSGGIAGVVHDRNAPLSNLDSMQVLDLLLSAEKEFGINLDAHALSAQGAMESFGSLLDFIEHELAGRRS